MGNLQFAIERFNTAVVAETGYRPNMEDTYLIQQDMGIDEFIKVSLFAVIDGHGGDYCSNYLKVNLEKELRD